MELIAAILVFISVSALVFAILTRRRGGPVEARLGESAVNLMSAEDTPWSFWDGSRLKDGTPSSSR